MSTWTGASPSTSLLYQARTALPPGALDLACHAAVPAVLDVGLLHLLRINFFVDPPTVLGHDVEAELLNSALFAPAGPGLYQVDPQLRGLLLAGLDAAYGIDRLRKVALLLEQYTNQADPWQPRELEYAQRLTALSIVEPSRAADWLANAQQQAAGRETFGQDWFVAMRERLTESPGDMAETYARLLDQQPTPDTVRALGQLGLLPGAPVGEIVERLRHLAESGDAAVAAMAVEVSDTLRPLFRYGVSPVPQNEDRHVSLLNLLALDPMALADVVGTAWRPRTNRDFLRVPIGETPAGKPVDLDLKEAAQRGMGPHGLVIGAGGSGRHELLRTIVTALALTHTPDRVNFLLVDSRWNTTFGALADLPHTAGTATALIPDPYLIDRLVEALDGELNRRKDLLREAGNFASAQDYERSRRAGRELEKLPTLVVICDEFTELLSAGPETLRQVFRRIGRTGRALGVHLMLSARRLTEEQLGDLATYLSYRIALRTDAASESRLALGTTEAHELPDEPGTGYLNAGPGPAIRFRAARLTGPIADSLDTVVDILRNSGPPARPVWLPPLTRQAALDEALGSLRVTSEHGLHAGGLHGELLLPIAVYDQPRQQRQDLFWIDLSGDRGHVAVVGARLAGKSPAIRTLVYALALTHTPREMQFYCLGDLAGSAGELRALPHVGGVADDYDTHQVRRTVLFLEQLVSQRQHDRDDGAFGIVFLIIDDCALFRERFPNLRDAVAGLAAEGAGYGVHLIVAARDWAEFWLPVDDFGSRLELRLDDPTTSILDPQAARRVPRQVGRGIVAAPSGAVVDFLALRPGLSGDQWPDPPARAVADAWTGSPAPPIPMLPDVLPYWMIPGGFERMRVPIGIGDERLQQIHIDFRLSPHFLVTGDPGRGKTSFLRALAATLTRQVPAEAVRVIHIDPMNGNAARLIASTIGIVEERLPGPDGSRYQPGPEVFVLVDDYHVLAGERSPLRPLVQHLVHGRDIGLHLVIAHRYTDRSAADPVLLRLRELNSAAMVLPGPRTEMSISAGFAGPMPRGRGIISVRDEEVQLIQLYLPPTGEDSET
ncbi:putative FtsK/SpoIIIE family protein [Actinoplanes missouriensis 431]|uniref:Putative FtsK/SpoIIIE family protein n=1 Tax=Actinoplanes missouriensis (strain ATCC 14538 / DSM 43046 / CBS 188.64 / JCM 3121 / NBRC 102363 / NCIMB 12654 / NRRL B-3342 / UNCC 431) TaxID=512565 RepID=I0H875_ACTM4|nr:FtsK/SpoIIIE domain-containing protein [Actinoplanes missouriensis]BAL89212.1 putative FtsK/SpoIIIE family protein [Actinoplanes missouriensis 431]